MWLAVVPRVSLKVIDLFLIYGVDLSGKYGDTETDKESALVNHLIPVWLKPGKSRITSQLLL